MTLSCGQDFDVESGWLAIAACIRDALRRADAAGDDVAAVAATSMREGIVLYDRRGAEIWACPNADSRAGREAEDLIREGAAERIFSEAGDWVSITTPARLRWLARHRPGILDRTDCLGMLSGWIVYRLARIQVTEPSCGSSSGMFSLVRRSWSESIAQARGIPASALPPVVDSGTPVGTVTAQAAAQTGLRAGTPVVTGGPDTQLGLLGAGIRAGEFTVLAETFWQSTVLADTPLIDPRIRLRTLCHVTPGEWMLEGIGFYCGMAMRWYRDAFCDSEAGEARRRGVDPYVVMEESAARIPPGSNGVIAILSNLMNARRWVHASPCARQLSSRTALPPPTTTAMPPGSRSAPGYSAFPRTACSTRSGGRRAPSSAGGAAVAPAPGHQARASAAPMRRSCAVAPPRVNSPRMAAVK